MEPGKTPLYAEELMAILGHSGLTAPWVSGLYACLQTLVTHKRRLTMPDETPAASRLREIHTLIALEDDEASRQKPIDTDPDEQTE